MGWDKAKVNITGRLGGDITAAGEGTSQRAKFRVAVTTGQDKDGAKETTWYDCTLFGKRAELAVQRGKKGARITVWGNQKLRFWTGQDGTNNASIDVIVEDFDLTDDKATGNSTGEFENGAAAAPAAGYGSRPAAAPAPRASMPF